MKFRIRLVTLLLIAPLATGTAMSQERYAPAGHSDGTRFGYATVLRVTRAWETYRSTQPEQVCDDRDGAYGRPDNSGRTTAGTVIGAVVGGALGNTIGKGDGRKATTIVGAVAGGAIGHHIASNADSGSSCRMVEGDHQVRRAAGFEVEYNYKGDIYVTRMAYDPGKRVRVRVTVVPDDRSAPPVGY